MLGFPHVKAGDEVPDKQSSWDRVFCDRISTNAYIDWTIKETSSGSKTYTLYCKNDAAPSIVNGNRYLVVDPAASGSNRLSSFILQTQPLTVPMHNGNSSHYRTLKTLSRLNSLRQRLLPMLLSY